MAWMLSESRTEDKKGITLFKSFGGHEILAETGLLADVVLQIPVALERGGVDVGFDLEFP